VLTLSTKLTAISAGLALLWAASFSSNSYRVTRVIWLVFSYCFYLVWGGWSLCLLILSSLMNYAVGASLRRNPTTWRLGIGFGLNLVLLCSFKYLPGIHGSFLEGSALGRFQHVLLPLGISFWTFQALSYLFDIYRENEDSDPTLMEFCLYMAFWPTVVSGPICRTSNLIPQFRKCKRPRLSDVATGTRRLCTGILMLGVSEALSRGIAGQGIDAAFARTDYRWTGIDVWFITIGYGFQLFFNFAGYSHLVIGGARLFGIELEENFNRPFLATTPAMFWSRWHMSLSSWIRDYVFIPMASRWRSLWWRNLALLISMILFGIWHGATFLFVLWGAYHGTLLVLHRQWQQVRTRIRLPRVVDGAIALLSWCFTFGAVSLGWVLFRAQGWHQALNMFKALADWSSYSSSTLPMACRFLIVLTAVAYFSIVGIAGLLDRVARTSASVRAIPAALQWISNERWVWVSPLAAVLVLYGFILVGHVGKVGSPLLYRLF